VASGDSNGFGNGNSIYPKVSDDGHVLFFTNAGSLTSDLANSINGTLVVRNLQNSDLAIAASRVNGTPVTTIGGGYDYHALSSDGTTVAFVSSELAVTGSGTNEYQVFVTPRP
jgi:Tol biopolymer transport system component